MILPIGQLMMADVAGPKRMGRVMSIVAVPAMLAPILGPTIGGLIVDNASWRWIFYVNVPIGVIAVIAALRILPRVESAPSDRLDVRGLALMATGLPLLTYGLAEIGVTGSFTATKVVVPCLAGLALIAAFVMHALRVPSPLLDLRLYRRPTFASASFAMFCLGGALFGSMILLPLYWQEIRGQSVVDTGLLTAPQGLGMALVMPLAGKLTDRWGGGPLALIGVVVTTIASIPFGLIGAHTSIFGLSIAMLVRGMGIGFAFMPAMAAAFASLERSGRRRHAAAQRPAARRRLDRDRRARGRAPACTGRDAHARGRRAGVRDGVLGGGRAHGPRDRPVHRPAARRAGRAGGQRRQRQSSAGRPRRGGGGMTADRIEALEDLGRSFQGVMGAVRRLRGRETHRPREAQLRPVQPALRAGRRRRALRPRARADR